MGFPPTSLQFFPIENIYKLAIITKFDTFQPFQPGCEIPEEQIRKETEGGLVEGWPAKYVSL